MHQRIRFYVGEEGAQRKRKLCHKFTAKTKIHDLLVSDLYRIAKN